MKRLFFLILTLLLLLCACGKETEQIWVETQKSEVFYDADGSVSSTLSVVSKYDKYGNLTRCRYLRDEKSMSTYYYSYDRQGNQTKKVTIDFWGWLSVSFSREKTEYDHNGNPVVHTEYDGWKEKERENYFYDENGVLIRQETVIEDKCTKFKEYTYEETDTQHITVTRYNVGDDNKEIRYLDDQGMLQRLDIYWGNELSKYTEYSYDDLGRLTLAVEYDLDSAETYTTEIRYDDEANTVTIIFFTGAYIINYLDDHGNIICEEFYESDGTISTRETFTYEQITVYVP